MKRVILYYQKFISLQPLFDHNMLPTHIHVSSIHFGKNSDKSSYIHLNDYHPNSSIFDSMWKDIEKAHNLGVKIILMVGGAGLAFDEMFTKFDLYYAFLKNTIKSHPYISGIDLDIEESVNINDVIKLINKIKEDFGDDFIISMAPVAFALQTNQVGMGGFLYKELLSKVNGKIDYLNTQFYYDFSEESYNEVIENDYNPSQIILGMTDTNINTFEVVQKLSSKYNNFGGVFFWEMCLLNDPCTWIHTMKAYLNNT